VNGVGGMQAYVLSAKNAKDPKGTKEEISLGLFFASFATLAFFVVKK
jgi:hypothetical protein